LSVCLTNAAMFALAATALVVTPATVSDEVTNDEVITLLAGVVMVVLVNAVLLRDRLLPLDRLARQLDPGAVTDPGWRPAVPERHGVERSFVLTVNALIDRLNEERIASASRERAAEDAERRRLARELHDQVGQRLTVVLLGLGRLAKQVTPQQAEELSLMQENARESLELVRGLAEGLRRGLWEDMDLVGALTSLATTFSSSSGLQITRRFEQSFPTLEPPAHEALFRVAQESLTNTARHAHASNVVMCLVRQRVSGQECVVLKITDDGTGYAPQRMGSGVAGMGERARAVGGHLSVETASNGGTEVRLAIPARHAISPGSGT
jgi:two-component system sensor histidine kinase UhpB